MVCNKVIGSHGSASILHIDRCENLPETEKKRETNRQTDRQRDQTERGRRETEIEGVLIFYFIQILSSKMYSGLVRYFVNSKEVLYSPLMQEKKPTTNKKVVCKVDLFVKY